MNKDSVVFNTENGHVENERTFPEENLRLKDFIADTNLNVKDFAKKIGISAAILYNIEHGHTKITVELIKAIMRAYPDYDMRYLLLGEKTENAVRKELEDIRAKLRNLNL